MTTIITKQAMTNNERQSKWYLKNKEKNHKRRVENRIRKGGIPQDETMEKFNITLHDINQLRSEGTPKLNSIQTLSQLSSARALVLKGKRGDPTTVFARVIPVSQPIPPEPIYTAKSESYVAQAGSGKQKSKKSKDDGAPGTSKAVEVNIPKSLLAIEECIRQEQPHQTTPITDKKTGKTTQIPVADTTKKKNLKTFTTAMMWWSKVIGVPLTMEEDISEWLSRNVEEMVNRADTVTHKDFIRQKKDMNVPMNIKHKFTYITGIKKWCPVWGEYFEERYPEAYRMIHDGMKKWMPLADQGTKDVSDKKVALPWQPVQERANEALNNPPSNKATYIEWADHIALILLAASKEGVKKGRGRPLKGDAWPNRMMHPWRDNLGNIKIVSSVDQIPKLENNDKERNPNGRLVSAKDYYLNPQDNEKSGRIYFRTHKTRKYTGEVEQDIPLTIHKQVKQFIKRFTREYLFIKPSTVNYLIKDQKPLGKSTTALIKKKNVLGMPVNDARHSFLTYFDNRTPRPNHEQKDSIAKAMMTSEHLYNRYVYHGEIVVE